MTDNPQSTFNLAQSMRMIDNILNKSDNQFTEVKVVPSINRLTYDNGFYVDCVALSVDIRDSSDLPKKHTRPVLAKIYRAYISEMTRLMKSCPLYRHTHIVGDAVMSIYNASQPSQHINEVFALSARISVLVNMLNNRLAQRNYTPLRVGIGMSYGRALMIQAGYYGSGINDVVWMGDVINETSKLCNKGSKKTGDGQFMISEAVYQRLSRTYKELLSWHPEYECYHGNYHDTKMQAQSDKIFTLQTRIKANPQPTTAPSYTAAPQIFNAVPTPLFKLNLETKPDNNPPDIASLFKGLYPK